MTDAQGKQTPATNKSFSVSLVHAVEFAPDALKTVKERTIMESNSLAYQLGLSKRPLIVTETGSEALYLAARNIPYVQVRDVQGLDPAALVGAEHVVMTSEAIKKIEEWLA